MIGHCLSAGGAGRGCSEPRVILNYVEHLMGDGMMIFEHVCRLGHDGILSKHADHPYRSGPSRSWRRSIRPSCG